ncbi:globin domain-containing protein [Roseobacteraceae bacterium S113]
MIPDDLPETIVSGFDRLTCEPNELTRRFYEILFERTPAARALFGDDIEKQADKLLDMLMFLVQSLETLPVLLPEIDSLGRRHLEYGAVAAHYDLVGEALLAALEEKVQGWSDKDLEAWSALYTLVAGRMLKSAEAAREALAEI